MEHRTSLKKTSILNRVKLRLDRYFDLLPPRHFWPIFFRFFKYGLKQAQYAAKYRNHIDPTFESHLNFKRAHFLEKAINLNLQRSLERDSIFKMLKAYISSHPGQSDPCLSHLKKISSEYEAYPDKFQCSMSRPLLVESSQQESMILRQIIFKRRSIRGFRPEPVSPDLMEQVIEAGRYAPSSCNAQPLVLVSITDRQTIDLIFGAALGARDWKDEIPTGILVAVDRRHYKPFEQHMVMAQDVAAATQNMLLMAHTLGLGACWVSLISDMHIEEQQKVYSQLRFPPYIFLGAAIAIGHPKSSVCDVPRRPLNQIWFKERFK